MGYLDQITVGSTTYDIQDSTAAASLAVDGSTLSLKDRNNSTLSSITLPSGLPVVTSSDDGKVLTVASGTWSAAEVEALPTVTSADNGKFLGVASGSWDVVEDISEFYYGNVQPTDPNIKFWVNSSGSADGGAIPSGGLAGQVLQKSTGTDYDVEWGSAASVHVGADAPTDPNANIWLDTDEQGNSIVTSVNGQSGDVDTRPKRVIFTIPYDNWGGNDPYVQTITLTGATITANTKVDIQFDETGLAQLMDDEVKMIFISNDNGTLNLYAFNAQTTADIIAQAIYYEVG